ncbi:MAG: methyltransferase domain-containing protein [Thermoplasmata archaeon]|nr:methyltransferase domain-containing protein [Thermoplasmata archaeon]
MTDSIVNGGEWDSILKIDLPEEAKQFLQELAEKVRSEIERANAVQIAEIGCGRGELIHKLARELPGCRFVGYEQSNEAISRLKVDALPNEEFQHLVLPEAPNRTFDCVLCINTLHYVPEALLSIRRLWTVVRTGGLLIFNYPNKYYAAQLPSEPQNEQWGIVEEPLRKGINLLSQRRIRSALPGAKQRRLHKSGRSNIYLVFEKPKASR